MCDMLHHASSSSSAFVGDVCESTGSNSIIGACSSVLAALSKCGGSISICTHTHALADLLHALVTCPEATAKKALACVLQLSLHPSCTGCVCVYLRMFVSLYDFSCPVICYETRHSARAVHFS